VWGGWCSVCCVCVFFLVFFVLLFVGSGETSKLGEWGLFRVFVCFCMREECGREWVVVVVV
jgi:hypothetical protein